MASKKFELIIFDLDDTLVPAESIYDEVMRDMGIAPTDPTFLQARQEVKQRLPSLAPVARSRFLYLKKYLELTGQYSAKKSLELGDAYEKLVIQKMAQEWSRLKRVDLFKELKQRGYRLAVLSNETCRLQSRKLSMFEGENEFFEFLLTSEERALEKPEPSLFQELLNHFQVAPSQTLMIGDSYENDIEPSVKLGISCLQTLEFKKSKKTHDQVIEKLDHILNFI